MPSSRGLYPKTGWSSQFVAQCRSRSWQSTRSFAIAATPQTRRLNSRNTQLRKVNHQHPATARNASWFSRSAPEPPPPATTSTSFTPDDASPSADLRPSTPVESTLSDHSDANGTSDLLDPHTYSNDYIGFLEHDYGIDFGIGTSEIVKTFYEYVHVYSGLPFAGSIVLAGAIVRLGMMFATKASTETSTKMMAMMPVTKPIMARAQEASRAGDRMKMQRIQSELKQVYKENGVQMYKFALQFINIPLGFGFWRTFRGMSDIPVVGMSHGGLAWFTDLTVRDPYFVLPVVVAALQHFSAKWAAENQATVLSEQQQRMQKALIYGLPALGLLVISGAPAAVQLHFATTSFFALATNVAFRSPAFRSWLKMSPRPNSPPANAPPPSNYKGTITVEGRPAATSSSKSDRNQLGGVYGLMSKFMGASSGSSGGIWGAAKKTASDSSIKARRTRQKRDDKEYETKRRRELEEERVHYEQYQEQKWRRKHR